VLSPFPSPPWWMRMASPPVFVKYGSSYDPVFIQTRCQSGRSESSVTGRRDSWAEKVVNRVHLPLRRVQEEQKAAAASEKEATTAAQPVAATARTAGPQPLVIVPVPQCWWLAGWWWPRAWETRTGPRTPSFLVPLSQTDFMPQRLLTDAAATSSPGDGWLLLRNLDHPLGFPS